MAQVQVNRLPDGNLVVTVILEAGDFDAADEAGGFAQTPAGQPTESNPPTEHGVGEAEAGSAEGATHTVTGADYSLGAVLVVGAEGAEGAGDQPAEVEGDTTGQAIAPPADTDMGAPGGAGSGEQPAEVEGDTTGQELAPPADTDRGAGPA